MPHNSCGPINLSRFMSAVYATRCNRPFRARLSFSLSLCPTTIVPPPFSPKYISSIAYTSFSSFFEFSFRSHFPQKYTIQVFFSWRQSTSHTVTLAQPMIKLFTRPVLYFVIPFLRVPYLFNQARFEYIYIVIETS